MKGDTDANGELKIIKAEILIVEPFINEIVQDIHIEEGQIIEDLRLLLALDQLLQSILTKFKTNQWLQICSSERQQVSVLDSIAEHVSSVASHASWRCERDLQRCY